MNWVVSKGSILNEVDDWKQLFPLNGNKEIPLFQDDLDSLKGVFKLNNFTHPWSAEVRVFSKRRQIHAYTSNISLKLDEAIDEFFSHLNNYFLKFQNEKSEMEGLGFECIGFDCYLKDGLILEKGVGLNDGIVCHRIFMNGKYVSKKTSLIAFLKKCKEKPIQEMMVFPSEFRDLILKMEF